MTILQMLTLAFVTVGLAGCRTSFTSIQKTGDSTYLLTKDSAGGGSLVSCTAKTETRWACQKASD